MFHLRVSLALIQLLAIRKQAHTHVLFCSITYILSKHFPPIKAVIFIEKVSRKLCSCTPAAKTLFSVLCHAIVHVSRLLVQLHYISPNLGGSGSVTTSASSATSTYAYIGTPPQLRRVSRLVWRQGPCHMIEDILSHNVITQIYDLGPNYVGSFQACGESL